MSVPPPRKRGLFRGQQLSNGRYRLLRKIGEGGNGAVWLAMHERMQAEVAIKFPIHNDHAEQLAFEDEIRSHVLLSNQHPHIVSILDVGEVKGRPFVVMQYLSQGSLHERIERNGIAVDSEELFSNARWIVAIAEALDFLHHKGVIHRDVKPANILLDSSLSTYLADFGIAQVPSSVTPVERDSKIVGSLPYMAPEILRYGKYGPGSDQFALAVTVYEVVTSRRPFEPKNSAQLAQMFDASIMPPSILTPGLPKEVDFTVLKALSVDPYQRFDSCLGFVRRLEDAWPAIANALRTARQVEPPGHQATKRPLPNVKVSSDDLEPPLSTGESKKIKLSRILPTKRKD